MILADAMLHVEMERSRGYEHATIPPQKEMEPPAKELTLNWLTAMRVIAREVGFLPPTIITRISRTLSQKHKFSLFK